MANLKALLLHSFKQKIMKKHYKLINVEDEPYKSAFSL